MQQRKGVVLVISAASGTGKTTLVKRLLAEFPNFAYSISCTTRQPREGEVNGVDYHFLSREDFIARRDQGYFAEWAEVYGNFYGSPLKPVLEKIEQGKDVIFEIDVQGAAQVRLALPQAHCIFILPPSLAELEKRLHGRGTDSQEIITRRMGAATQEISQAHWFDTWVVNDDLELAYDRLRAAYVASTLAPALAPHYIRALLAQEK